MTVFLFWYKIFTKLCKKAFSLIFSHFYDSLHLNEYEISSEVFQWSSE